MLFILKTVRDMLSTLDVSPQQHISLLSSLSCGIAKRRREVRQLMKSLEWQMKKFKLDDKNLNGFKFIIVFF
jgi:hypothetical protein